MSARNPPDWYPLLGRRVLPSESGSDPNVVVGLADSTARIALTLHFVRQGQLFAGAIGGDAGLRLHLTSVLERRRCACPHGEVPFSRRWLRESLPLEISLIDPGLVVSLPVAETHPDRDRLRVGQVLPDRLRPSRAFGG